LRRPLVLVAFGAFLGLGFLAFTALNIDAYPDPARTDSKRYVLLGFRQLQFKMFFRTDLSGLPRKPSCPSPPPLDCQGQSRRDLFPGRHDHSVR
jgi:hypothetical protein